MQRRDFLKSLGAVGSLLMLQPTAFANSPRFRLLFLTDFHARPEFGAPEALEEVARQVNDMQPDLVIGGGDCIHGGFAGDPATSRERFTLFKAFTDKIEAPAHWTIGNHDFVAAVDREGAIVSDDPTAMFRETMGVEDLHTTFEAGGHHFICLQSVEVIGGELGYRGFIDASQKEWLKKTIAQIPADSPIILVSHIPLRTTFIQVVEEPTSPLSPKLVVENANEVLALFEDRALPLVLQGHLHSNERIIWNDTTFVMGGAVSGAWWKGPNRGTEEGFGHFEFGESAPFTYRYHDYGWEAQAG